VTVILVLAMFTAFLAIERFTDQPASEFGLQVAAHTKAEERTVKRVTKVSDKRLDEVRAGSDRRQAERRDRGNQSAA